MPTHSETRQLPYSADQMYALVADVAKYPEFLPWCAAARIRSREDLDDHESSRLIWSSPSKSSANALVVG